jgi:class 3 adenylate cyclase/tetratricopeptide (TPR) repeat protein
VEGQDPEQAAKLIQPILRIMMEAVHRYEGTVNHVLGDGIMALFGAPLAHEDHALRACYAALAMQQRIDQVVQKAVATGDPVLQLGIGLNSGEVVVRSIDNDLNIDYLALGDTIHLGARMQETAAPGSILLTGNTLREIEGFVQVKPLGPLQAKGFSRPVEAFELLGVTSVRKRLEASAARGLTEFVGRAGELETFKRVAQQAHAGQGQILALVGEPGVGKSRLIHEFIHYHAQPDSLVLEGASASYGKATPYFPIIELLQRYFSISEGESSETIRAKVTSHLLELDERLRDALPAILALVGALPDPNRPANGGSTADERRALVEAVRRFNDMEPQQRRRQTLETLRRVLVCESQRQPLVLIFEDLHWIDNETQAFLDNLVESMARARILLLVNYRPGYTHSWSNKTYYAEVRVDPLPSTGAAELLQYLLGADPGLAPLKTLLIERTEGNPFFIEESVRSLLETSVLTGDKGSYTLAQKIENIRMPSKVQTVLADRIDRLPLEQKHLLQTAAVIGVKVPLRLLRAVAELPDSELHECLTGLQSAEFVYESNLFPELEYTFKHALTNEVVYGALLHDRRTSLHTRIVSVLEDIAGDNLRDYIETLAHHSFRGELWNKAVIYLKDAGAKAMLRSANKEAASFFDRALTALEHLPQTPEILEEGVDIRLDLRNALFLLGEFALIHTCLNEAQSIAESLNNPRKLRRVLNFRLSYFNLTGEPHRVIELGKHALALGVGSDDPGLDIVTNYYMGIAYHMTGLYGEAISLFKRAMAKIDERNLRHERFGTSTILAVSCRLWIVQSLAQTGSFNEADAWANEGIQIANEVNHPYSLAYINCSLGFLLLMKGDLDSAIGVFRQCLRLCQAANIRVLYPQIASYLGFACGLSGRTDEALSLLEEAEEQTISIGRNSGRSLRVGWHGASYLISGRVAQARALADRAVELSQLHHERGHSAWAMKLLGDIASDQDSPDMDAAETHYRRALALADELGMRPLAAHCHLGLGRLYHQGSQSARARVELADAMELYRSMEMNFWLREAESVWAQARFATAPTT